MPPIHTVEVLVQYTFNECKRIPVGQPHDVMVLLIQRMVVDLSNKSKLTCSKGTVELTPTFESFNLVFPLRDVSYIHIWFLLKRSKRNKVLTVSEPQSIPNLGLQWSSFDTCHVPSRIIPGRYRAVPHRSISWLWRYL